MKPIPAVFRLALFGLALAGSASARDGGTSPAPTRARSADRFVDSIGVNTHFNYRGTVYETHFEEVKRLLLAAGIRHVRDEALSEQQQPETVERYRLLAAAGIKFCLLCFEHPATRRSHSPLEEKLATLSAHFSTSLAYIEGHNEPDGSWPDKPNWAPGSAAYIKKIRALAQADPRLRPIPIAGSAVAHPERPAVRAAMRDQNLTAIVDVANMHPYSGGTPNESRIERRLQEVREFYQNPRIIATEVGYHTAVQNKPGGHEPVTEEGRAIYLPRLLMENFRLGIERSYIYQLADSRPPNLTDIESLFGLLTHEAKPTLYHHALKNLIAILRDDGAGEFTPGTLGFAVASPPEGLRTVLLQKRSGTYYLAVWRPLKIHDQIKRVPLPVTTQTVTVNLERAAALRVYLPNESAQPVRTLAAGTSAELPLDARLVILEVRSIR